MRKSTRFQSLERVDLPDMDALADDLLRDQLGQVVDAPLTNSARQRLWVLSGFAQTNPAAKQLQVARGRALLGTRVDGVVEYGLITTDGDLTKTVDLNAYAAGTYGVYIRFERVQGELESRAFWDPSGGGNEYSQAVNSRWTANWSVRVEAGSPGAEWLQIGQVDQATMAITDMRPLYFEGRPDAAYESGWSAEGGGSADDRDVDRAAYGVGDLQMFSAAVRQCLEDLKGRGLRRWWEKGIGGMNVGFDDDPVEDALAVGDANFGLSWDVWQPRLQFEADTFLEFSRADSCFNVKLDGTFIFEIEADGIGPMANNMDLGMTESGIRWRTLYSKNINHDQTDGFGVINNLKPALDDVSDLGTAARRWEYLRVSKDVIASRDVSAVHDVSAGAGLFGVDLTLTGFVKSNLTSTPTSTYSLGTDPLRWKELFLSSLLDIKSTTAAYLKMYGGSAAVNNRFWQWVIGASGELVLQGGTDAGAGLFDLLGITRSGVTPGTALLSVRGAAHADVNSGYPATVYPALRASGVEPFLRIENTDPTVDAECVYWLVGSITGGMAADATTLYIRPATSAGIFPVTADYLGAGMLLKQRGGGALQYLVDEIILGAYNEVRVPSTLSVEGDQGVPADADALGLTNDLTDLVGAPAGVTVQVNGGLAGNLVVTGWVKIYFAGSTRYLPVMTTITP